MEAYERMTEKLKEEHDRLVDLNWKLRGIELAIRQIHDMGHVKVDYPLEVLKERYETLEKAVNKLQIEVMTRRDTVLEYATYTGIDTAKVTEIFGW